LNYAPDSDNEAPAILPLANLPLSTASPSEIIRLLFSHPYVNFVPQLFDRTREFELGLEFIERCRVVLSLYYAEIPKDEAAFIECNLTLLELSFLDRLNRWAEYLDLFEKYFREKRTKAYILRYKTDKGLQSDVARFGRYLLHYDYYGCYAIASVHTFYLSERRRAIIERKQARFEQGKNVDYLKRHQKDRLSFEERERRYHDLMRLLRWIRKASDDR